MSTDESLLECLNHYIMEPVGGHHGHIEYEGEKIKFFLHERKVLALKIQYPNSYEAVATFQTVDTVGIEKDVGIEATSHFPRTVTRNWQVNLSITQEGWAIIDRQLIDTP